MSTIESSGLRFIITKPRDCKGSLDLQFHIQSIHPPYKYSHLDGWDIANELKRHKAIPKDVVPQVFRGRIRFTEDEMSKVIELIKKKVLC